MVRGGKNLKVRSQPNDKAKDKEIRGETLSLRVLGGDAMKSKLYTAS